MADFGILAWIALYYEIAILIVYSIFLFMILKRYQEKHNEMTKILFYFFLSYEFAIIFSLISKLFNALWGGVPYSIVDPSMLWLVARLHAGRFGFAMTILGAMYCYRFRSQVFEKETKKKRDQIIYGLGAVSVVLLILMYQFDSTLGKSVGIYDIIAFIILFLYVSLIFFPFMNQAFNLAKRIEEKNYQSAIYSLGLMAMGFMLIFFSLLLDRLMLITFSWAYSVFYFAAWIFAILAILSAYLGYIKPTSK